MQPNLFYNFIIFDTLNNLWLSLIFSNIFSYNISSLILEKYLGNLFISSYLYWVYGSIVYLVWVIMDRAEMREALSCTRISWRKIIMHGVGITIKYYKKKIFELKEYASSILFIKFLFKIPSL